MDIFAILPTIVITFLYIYGPCASITTFSLLIEELKLCIVPSSTTIYTINDVVYDVYDSQVQYLYCTVQCVHILPLCRD